MENLIRVLVGYILGIGLILSAILAGGDITAFIDIPSILIILGIFGAFLVMGKSSVVMGNFTRENSVSKLVLCQLLTLGLVAGAMMGDFIGAIKMMGNLSDPNAIGPSMAVALITTLYGLILVLFLTGPLEDQAMKETKEFNELSLSQILWGIFPIYSIIMGFAVFFILLFSLSTIK